MKLSELLSIERIGVPLKSPDKEGAITELIDLLAQSGGLSDRAEALEAVLKREAERTTGIGYGLAIPHGKPAGCTELLMAAGKPETPIDFSSLDGRPVTFVVLLVSPADKTKLHIEALSKISRLMNIEEFRDAIDAADSSQALLEAITRFEQ